VFVPFIRVIGVVLGAKAIKKGEALVPACSKGLVAGTVEKLRNPFRALGGQLISRLILESTWARASSALWALDA